MAYTTVGQVAGMFPLFKRGTPQQNPPDSLIQQFTDDVNGDIDAILKRRFQQQIIAYGPTDPANFQAFAAALSQDALNVLEKINRYGAAQQLGQTLGTLGVASAERLGKDFGANYGELLRELEGIDAQQRPLPRGGRYDHLFDPLAASQSVRPALIGVAGGDQPVGQTPADIGSSAVFGKFDTRGT